MPHRPLCKPIVACLSLILSTSLWAQTPSDRFLIDVAGGRITGSEEYALATLPGGFRLTGTITLTRSNGPLAMKQELLLDAGRRLVRYRLDVSVGGQEQTVEVWREGEQFHMRADAGGDAAEKTIEALPNTVVLDNLIVSHYQVLLDRLAAETPGRQQWQVLVPQRLASVPAKLTLSEDEERGTLADREIALRKYSLEIGGTLIEFWAEKTNNRLMRLSVPVQKVEMVREGFVPASPEQPSAEEPAAFIERELAVPSDGLQLPATVCLPAATAPRFPIVVFVHGSGPNDRDETIGPNKPFRDIAHGLAAHGIASLRYDKRTFAFRDEIEAKSITLEEEVLADAVAALDYARHLEEIDPSQVFLLGHSLGATLAPFIAERAPALRGAILLAPLGRPIDETLLAQLAYRGRVAGLSEEVIAEQQEELGIAFERVRSGEAEDDEIIFFAPARYWRELLGRDVLAALRRLPLPILVLQGGKDYQVTAKDFELVRNALSDKPAELHKSRVFPGLNHLFMSVDGDSTGIEYGRPSKVEPVVIDAIRAWIESLPATRSTE